MKISHQETQEILCPIEAGRPLSETYPKVVNLFGNDTMWVVEVNV